MYLAVAPVPLLKFVIYYEKKIISGAINLDDNDVPATFLKNSYHLDYSSFLNLFASFKVVYNETLFLITEYLFLIILPINNN